MASAGLRAALALSPVWDSLDGGACIIACSGGRDSVALACATVELLKEPDFAAQFTSPPQLALWHLDHGLRQDSNEDANFVAELAEKLDIPCIVERAELNKVSGNTEANARKERYQRLLNLLVDPIPTDDLPMPRRALTAHHLGDQVETVLHHLVRGTHLRGLRGISEMYQQVVFRPWLHEPPETIAQYIAECEQVWSEDSTNSDTSFTRNRLRFNVIPELRLINPRAREHIARLAAIAQDVQSIIDQQVDQLAVETLPAVGLMPWLPLLSSPRGRYYSHFLESGWNHPTILAEFVSREISPRLHNLNADDYESLANWTMESMQPLLLQDVRLRVHQSQMLTISFPVSQRDYNVSVGLILNQSLKQGRLEVALSNSNDKQWSDYLLASRMPWEYLRNWPDFLIGRVKHAHRPAVWKCFLPAKIHLPLTLRNWHTGDAISLLGGGTKKLGDIFTDAKVPENFRACWSVLTDANDQILWVPGLADSILMNLAGQQPAYCVELTSRE